MSALEEYLVGEPESEDGDGPVDTPAGLEQADWHLRRLARLRRLMAENEAVAAVEIQRVRVWLAEENEKLSTKAAWIEQALTLFHQSLLTEDSKRKTVSLPAGTLKARKHPDSVVVLDADAFARWAASNGRLEFIRTRTEVVKAEVKRLLSVGPLADDTDPGHVAVDPKSGEAVPGVVIVPGQTSFAADTPDLREVAL
jgi:phage host-nuclease inhibitor protein Gam